MASGLPRGLPVSDHPQLTVLFVGGHHALVCPQQIGITLLHISGGGLSAEVPTLRESRRASITCPLRRRGGHRSLGLLRLAGRGFNSKRLSCQLGVLVSQLVVIRIVLLAGLCDRWSKIFRVGIAHLEGPLLR